MRRALDLRSVAVVALWGAPLLAEPPPNTPGGGGQPESATRALAAPEPAEGDVRGAESTSHGVDRRADAAAEPEPSLSIPIFHSLGLMAVMRATETVIWPEPFADFHLGRMGSSYRRAFTEPPRWDGSRAAFEWDGDPWYVNGIGHALFGSEVYLRARTCRNGVLVSLALATAASTLWEYGIEAAHVQPSGFDLWYTPLSGLVLGELRYLGWSAAARLPRSGLRRALKVVLDPLGELERAAGTDC